MVNDDKKRNWCQALVGEAGRSIIKQIPPRTSWDAIKQELLDVLGEANPTERAFDDLLHYKPKEKGLGEIALDIIGKTHRATNDPDAQLRLGLKAFISAMPEEIGRQLRRKHFTSIREALEEARFLQRAEEEEKHSKEQVMAVGKEDLQVPQQDIVEACIKNLQEKGLLGAVGTGTGTRMSASAGDRSNRGKRRCWCCGEEGHFLMQCPTVVRNRTAQYGASPKSGNA